MPDAPGQKTWFAGLDGLRAVAAFGVLITHVGIMSGYVAQGVGGEYIARAEVGVALFFVLSGFLLYRPFVAARLDDRPALNARRYLRHRFVRIFPAYWVALTVLVVVLDTRGRDDMGSPLDIFLYYTLLQSWSENTALGGLQQAWTLHNELMFYLLLPLWAAGMVWLRRRLPARGALQFELAALAGLAVLALTWRTWLHMAQDSYDPADFDPRFHWILGQLHMFVPGMALALALEWGRRHQLVRPLQLMREHPLGCWALAGVAFWAVSTQVGINRQLGAETIGQDLGQELLYLTTGFLLVAPVALAGSELPGPVRWLNTRVMATLGAFSYGIYLWHVGVIDMYLDTRGVEENVFGITPTPFLPMLAAVSLGSVAVAALSYLLVEKPALRRKDPRSVRGARSGDGPSGFGSIHRRDPVGDTAATGSTSTSAATTVPTDGSPAAGSTSSTGSTTSAGGPA